MEEKTAGRLRFCEIVPTLYYWSDETIRRVVLYSSYYSIHGPFSTFHAEQENVAPHGESLW